MRIIRTFVAVAVAALLSACALDGDEGENVDSTVEFLESSEDVTIDPNDPPDDPDPQVDEELVPAPAPASGDVGTVSSGLSKKKQKKHKKGGKPNNGPMVCGSADALSPSGLTFVIHVSRDDATAARMVEHLKALKGYIRDRDVFMVDHGSQAFNDLRALFPCNRFHAFVREPNQLAATLENVTPYEAVAVDWELYDIRSHDQAWSTQRLGEFADKIHAKGKRAGFMPFWFGKNFSDKKIMNGSRMQYDLVQIQATCVNSADKFGAAAHAIANEFGPGGLKNVGFEISMNSVGNADAHVNAARAAACTEKAYRKGARAIYIYGNQSDQFAEYFQRLGKSGVRRPD